MAVREPAPKDLLTRFSHPLWERLRLEDLKPEWIVKGQHRGYDWMAIELTHRATGFVMGSNRLPDTTTVFVLRLLRKSKGWYLPADRIPPGGGCAWTTNASTPQRWASNPACAIGTAGWMLRRMRRTKPCKRGLPSRTGQRSRPLWRPRAERAQLEPDGHWVLFWTMVALELGGGVLLILAMGYNDWQRHGAIIQCNAATHMATVLRGCGAAGLRGWQMWLYLGILATPLLGIGKLLHTMATRMNRPGFTLQINVEGAILVGCAFALSQALGALPNSRRGVC